MYSVETLADERSLVLRLIDGDEDAFCELYAAYKERLLYFAMRFLKSKEYAEDIRRIKRKKWMFGIVFFSVIAFAIVYLLHLTIVGWQTRPVSYTETIEIIEEE